ncbi:hypothetical protein N4T77_02790 [Clostridium sp. CX1]|uniref:hypothetical protein n=1 Tax=Clostridium sp. CX1 TaxID=2978346 RepID=UPI0021C10A05|nr:hypothetical protein [Clostridium sp. CX1]MCT8975518.1 hypothetical protein [Clostridium sp. CX1]
MEDYNQDAQNYINLVNEFNTLQDTEYARAYKLHKNALAQYERWSNILIEVRELEQATKTKQTTLKGRIEHIMRVLNNIYTSSRMVWNKGEIEFKTKG